jgi:hypothetical protein
MLAAPMIQTAFMRSGTAYSESASGKPAWVSETIEVVGHGVRDPAKYPRRSESKRVAKRKAILDARRNLLEKVLKVKLNPTATIRDIAPQEDVLDASTSELISKAKIKRTYFYTGTYTVWMELNLKYVYKYLKKQNLI